MMDDEETLPEEYDERGNVPNELPLLLLEFMDTVKVTLQSRGRTMREAREGMEYLIESMPRVQCRTGPPRGDR